MWLVGKAHPSHADAGKLPKIFYVNWFRCDAAGKFLWPGFGENVRVLKWAIERIEGRATARDTPIGRVPTPESLDVTGLDISAAAMAAALDVDLDEWRAEIPGIEEWFHKVGEQLPTSMHDELAALELRLGD